MQTRTETRSLFALGYTVAANPLCPTAFWVWDEECSERYSVDAKALTCECADYRFNCHKPGYLCKHLSGLALLVKQQISDCYAKQGFFATQDRGTMTQKAAAKKAGESCIRFATELEWLVEDLGLVVVEQKPAPAALPLPEPHYPPMEQMMREWDGLYEEEARTVPVATVRRAVPIRAGRVAA